MTGGETPTFPTAAWLSIARRREHWSQEEVGVALGVSRVMVSYWESGKREPSRDQLAALTRLYGWSELAVALGSEAHPDLAAVLIAEAEGRL